MGTVGRTDACIGVQDIFTSCFEPHLQNLGEDGCSVYNTAWLLFLYAKARLLPPFPDLVSSFNLLLCTINFLLAHVPLQHQCFLPSDAQRYALGGPDTFCPTLNPHSLILSVPSTFPVASLLALDQECLFQIQKKSRNGQVLWSMAPFLPCSCLREGYHMQYAL